MSPQIAWIGLGNMGLGMCTNLVKKGNLSSPLIVYNRTVSKATAFAETLGGPSKATAASSITEAVTAADIIFICVGDDPAVEGIVSSALTGDVKGKLFVDCSTVHPDTTRKIDAQIRAQGASFVASPVFGAPAMADAGQLICVLSGPKSEIAKILPYTVGVISRANMDLTSENEAENDIGRAGVMKLLGNSFVISFVEKLGEGMTFAEKSGLGTDPLKQWMELMFPGPLVKYIERMQTGDYWKREYPLFQVDLVRKDARHIMNIAKDSGMRMRSVEVADKYLVDVKEHMGERGDIAGMYGAIRKESGLNYEN
ncbi:6-phosphogluconate dehydrogenase family protein [Talaromyces proteolyticus]|uniref:6-phosphogluconate dehydrogenase family protein n=1 Tax=Talaromyces proteolyticus TaxID=1131652 RepID=A0AAD4KGS8_9EURO|nr:6-phosphogluconate dehydrogenase family protein [Talaromyces proteolyticus]KAH8691436.1 6-phosphogluconate dehydrogenase family protein [Talaromyces proteolyticus]